MLHSPASAGFRSAAGSVARRFKLHPNTPTVFLLKVYHDCLLLAITGVLQFLTNSQMFIPAVFNGGRAGGADINSAPPETVKQSLGLLRVAVLNAHIPATPVHPVQYARPLGRFLRALCRSRVRRTRGKERLPRQKLVLGR